MPKISVAATIKATPTADLPPRRTHYTLQNDGDTNKVYCAVGKGGTNNPVVGETLVIGPGESVCSKDLPAKWYMNAQDGLRFICDTGLTTDVILDY